MRLLRLLVLVLGIVVWGVGCSPTAIQYLYAWEILPDDYRFGDLYRLSNLPQFKEKRVPCPSFRPQHQASRPKLHLYVIGDSFTESQRITGNEFDVDAYYYVHWSDILHLRLDATAQNVVLLETVERHVRDHFEFGSLNVVLDSAIYIERPQYMRLKDKLDNAFAANQAEDRLELLLFQYTPFLWIKEAKAAFTYKWFGRVNERTTVSPDGRHILYYLDTDSTLNSSNFKSINAEQLDTLVQRINTSASVLQRLGFDRVGLSIIPNKTTILYPEPRRYNQLISRIYEHPALQVQTVDVLPAFRALGTEAYLHSDSHWTCTGQRVWLEQTNSWLFSLYSLAL